MNSKETLIQFVDLLMPELTPHETSMYIFLLRHSHLENDSGDVRIGQRTIAQKYGRGPKMAIPSRAHILRQLKSLERKGCIHTGDTNRDGTLYHVVLPQNVPLVVEKLVSSSQSAEEDDYFTDLDKRKLIYERDKWVCQYCGEMVDESNVTLDHFVPRCKDGKNNKENLRTACLLCNSVKSGKPYEEAAMLLLKSIQERKQRENRNSNKPIAH
ncbi:HNH endonuclease signature motif containing protein [uncultured Desulfobulbus sp.]|uniref:HNH endonuclease n=1 Tax=uncultured Desulfobulbus sp. TaxID=239745 RepID=UPI0029C8DB21|nr:HNH endonuclease signature motif containing protein [uncultured Desulfobulbus sp.]